MSWRIAFLTEWVCRCGAVMTAGLIYAASCRSERFGVESFSASKLHTGLCIASVGAAVIVLSVIPIARHGVTLDERGLVVNPSEQAPDPKAEGTTKNLRKNIFYGYGGKCTKKGDTVKMPP